MVALFYPSKQSAFLLRKSWLFAPHGLILSEKSQWSYITVTKCNRECPQAKIFVKGTGSKGNEMSFTVQQTKYKPQRSLHSLDMHSAGTFRWVYCHVIHRQLWASSAAVVNGHWACSHSHHLSAVLPVQHHAHHSYPVPSPEQRQHHVHISSEQVCKDRPPFVLGPLSSGLSTAFLLLPCFLLHQIFMENFLLNPLSTLDTGQRLLSLKLHSFSSNSSFT